MVRSLLVAAVMVAGGMTARHAAGDEGVGRSVLLSWDASDTNAVGYTLAYGIAGLAGEAQRQDTDTNASWVVRGLEPAATYRFVVMAYNAYRVESDPSDPVYWTTPTVVTALSGDQDVRLRWLLVSNALGYVVKRAAQPGGPYTVVRTNLTGNWADSGLINGQDYYYRVSVLTSSGESPDSNEASGLPDLSPAGVATLNISNGVYLSWVALPDALSYAVYRADEAGGPYAPLALGIQAAEFVDTSAGNGRAYYYVVVGERLSGQPSGYSKEATAITPPDAPEDLTATLFAATTVQLTWTLPDPLVDESLMERSTDGVTFEPVASAHGTETNYLASVALASEYYFRVRARNSGGISGFSAAAHVTTPAFGLNVNFGPGAPVPAIPGYANDDGSAFGPKAGLVYGWSNGPAGSAVIRQSPASPDPRYDTFLPVPGNRTTQPAASWAIEVPNGFYAVRIAAGDPSVTADTSAFLVKGGLTASGAPLAGHWLCFTNVIRIDDGRLTIEPSPTVSLSKLCFVDIYSTIPVSPVFGDSPSSQTVTQNFAVVLSASIVDGSAPMTWQWFHEGTPVAGAMAGNVLLPHAQRADAGNYFVVVSNLVGTVTSAVAQVTVLPTDYPPQISPINTQNISEDTSGVVSFQVTDPDGPAALITVAGHSDNPVLLPDSSLSFAGSGGQRQLDFVPSPNASGSAFITLVVTDVDHHSITQRFAVNVAPVNDPPTLDPISSRVILTNSGPQMLTLTGISAGAPDEQEPLALSVTASPPGLLTALGVQLDPGGAAGTLQFTPADNAEGHTVITVTVDDGQARSNQLQRSFTLTVGTNSVGPLFLEAECGDRMGPTLVRSDPTSSNGQHIYSPTANLGFASFPVLLSGAGDFVIWCRVLAASSANDSFFVSVDGQAEDIYDTTLDAAATNAWRWTRINGRLAGNPRLFSLSAGAHTLTFRTREPFTLLDALWITPDPSFVPNDDPSNQPPTLNALADLVIAQNAPMQAVLLSGISSGSPLERQSLSIEATSSNPGLIPDPVIAYQSPAAAGLLTFAPVLQATGTATIRVVINDHGFGDNLTTRLFTINVMPAGHSARISGLPQFVSLAQPPTLLLPFTVSDSDNDPGALLLSAFSSNPTLVPPAGLSLQGNGANRVLAVTPNPNQSGVVVITVQLANGTSGTAGADVVLSVPPAPRPPVLSAFTNVTLNEDQSIVLPFTVSDPATPPEFLAVTVVSENPALSPSPGLVLEGNGSNRTLTLIPRPKGAGASTITVQATDLTGLSTQSSFLLTVIPVDYPPTLTALPGIIIDRNSSTGPLPFLIGDRETSEDQLEVTVTSSNPAVIGASGLALEGHGARRTLTVTPNSNQVGTATILLTVADGSGLTATSRFVATVRSVNSPPTLDPIPDLVLHQNSGPVTVPLNSIGPGGDDAQPVVVRAISSDPNVLPNPVVSYTNPSQTGSLSLRPGTAGQATVQVTVDDGQPQFGTVIRSFLVTVQASNSVPILAPLANQQIDEDTTLNLNLSVSDADTPVFLLTVTGSSDNPVLLPGTNIVVSGSGSNRVLSVTPARDQSGSGRITLTVSDGVLRSSNSFALTVAPVNDPPTLAFIPDFSTNSASGNPSYGVPLSGITSGASNESQTLAVTAHSSNLTLLPDPTVTYQSPNSSGTLTLRPVRNKTGTATVTVTVTDGAASNNTFSRAFLVNIYSSGNAAPVLSSIPDLVIAEDTVPNPIPFTVSDAETPVASLVLTAVSTNQDLLPDANIVLAGTGTNRTLTLFPATNRFGTAIVLLSARDAGSRERTVSFLLTVTPVNDPPAISKIADQTLVGNSSSPPLRFTVADVDTPVSNLGVTAHSSNPGLFPDAGLILGGSGTERAVQLTPAPNQSGTALIILTVSDGTSSVSSSFQATVTPLNTPPSLSAIPDQIMDEDTPSLPIPFQVADTQSPAASLGVTVGSSNPGLFPAAGLVLSGSGANRTLTLIPARDQNGSAMVTITVSDGTLSQAGSFAVEVRPVNDPPTLDPIPDYRIRQDAPSQTVTLTGLGTGAANEAQALIITAYSSAPAIVPHPTVTWIRSNELATLSFAPAFGARGSVLITVAVSDGQPANNLVIRTFTIVVDGAPVLLPPPAQVALEDTPVGPLPIRVEDLDGPSSSVTLSAFSSNSNIVSQAGLILGGEKADRTLQVIPVKDGFGPVWVTLVAADPTGNTTVSGFLLTFLPVNDAPALDPISDQVIGADASSLALTLAGIHAGAANEVQALTLLAESSDPSLIPAPTLTYVSPASTARLLLKPVPGRGGTAVITVTVVDDGSIDFGGTNHFSRQFSVSVIAPEQASFPVLRLDLQGNSGILSWPAEAAEGYRLFSSTNSLAPWTRVPFVPVLVQRLYLVPVSLDSSGRFFRLCQGCP